MTNQSYIAPYNAVCLTFNYVFVKNRNEMDGVFDRIDALIGAAVWLASTKKQVKLVVLQEAAVQGFPDELYDMDPNEYIDKIALTADGPEMARFGELAKQYGVYLVAGVRTYRPEFPGRYFNEGILFNPEGEIILRHTKNSVLYPGEHCSTPHDVMEQWEEMFGSGLDAFFPVAKTEIGISVAMDGSYPEYIRGLAMNGAEILCRVNLPSPYSEAYEIQNKAHALFNTMYVVASQMATASVNLGDEPISMSDGRSQIIRYDGQVLSQKTVAADSYMAGEVDVEALREFRISAQVANWIKDLRTEVIQKIYEKPILPANMNKDKTAYNTPQYTKALQEQVHLMIARGIFTPPSAPGWEERVVGANIKDK
ncbi:MULTISPECIES: nitrilase-related carbon-nitrogen hydrolase [unclassified Pseudovibrio]|uniref:nitrilase-related carbon-nitrogen hydrolase n=1 Tax=unclassified Pseudovibrio TaxID=2627060 RepID=UPI0007AED1B7|nr:MULTISPECIES: nitrilase-related carbon-nitrogen hydrolase [unclassified Pseudovibrio]KZL17266.1 Aliphatic amidase [Pseudovibrio sp. WM33]KZL23635.1 Aliphatic amidase [Pseudovibrio sp. Ad37]